MTYDNWQQGTGQAPGRQTTATSVSDGRWTNWYRREASSRAKSSSISRVCKVAARKVLNWHGPVLAGHATVLNDAAALGWVISGRTFDDSDGPCCEGLCAH